MLTVVYAIQKTVESARDLDELFGIVLQAPQLDLSALRGSDEEPGDEP